MSLLANFDEFDSAISGRLFLPNCFASDGFTSICGVACSACLNVAISCVVLGECRILKNVNVDGEVPKSFLGVVRILARSLLRNGLYMKKLDRSISA